MSKNLKKFIKHFSMNSNTPSFYYDIDEIVLTLKTVFSNKPKNFKIIFPVKSFADTEFYSQINEIVDGYDISNKEEFDQIKNFADKEVFCSAPYLIKSFSDDVIYGINSSEKNQYSKYIIRITLDSESRFGLPLEDVSKELMNKSIGVHFHSQWWEGNSFESVDDVIDKIIEKYNPPKGFIFNIGGGYNKLELDKLKEAVYKLCSKYSDYEFVIESGRAIIKNNGFLLGKVIDIQNINSKKLTRVITSISSVCHLRWELQGSTINFFNINSSKQHSSYNNILICGPTVYEGDRTFSIETQKTVNLGDIVVIDKVSGYAMAWNHSFNGIEKAKVSRYQGGKFV